MSRFRYAVKFTCDSCGKTASVAQPQRDSAEPPIGWFTGDHYVYNDSNETYQLRLILSDGLHMAMDLCETCSILSLPTVIENIRRQAKFLSTINSQLRKLDRI